MGVREIIARAATDRQADILRSVGASRVVQIETEMGRRIGADITMPLAQDLLDLASDYRVVPWDAHGPLVGKTLADSKIRQQYQINVLGVRPCGAKLPGAHARLEAPKPDYVIRDGDTLLLVGYGGDVSRFVAEVGG
jgi:trk system potassium uptake protein TrkA